MNHNELQQFILTLVEALGVSVETLNFFERKSGLVFNVETKDEALFTKNEDEVLRALNHIVKRVSESASEAGSPVHVSVDINNRDTNHIEFLETQARSLGERVQNLKVAVDMPPMNSYDRMIVHEALKNMEHVTTESHGEGSLRHVVISYSD